MKKINKILTITLICIMQVIWLPIGLLGFLSWCLAELIDLTHHLLCDFVRFLQKVSDE